jgi:four helix bundle protein
MTFKRFEEIEAWQLAREMCKVVKILTKKPGFNDDWELRKQARNSSGSAMDCIAEGHERGNNTEFKYFLGIAQGSCGEVRSQGYRALDYEYINIEELKELHTLAIRTSAAISALIRYLNKSDFKGLRYPKPPPSIDPNFPCQE